MQPAYVLLLSIVAIFVVLAVLKANAVKSNREEQRRKNESNAAEAEYFFQKVQSRRGLEPVATNLLLKAGETAYHAESSDLFEPRAVRVGTNNRVGFRVARGVWVGTGTSQSESTDVWKKIDSGLLVITNRRIIFDGQMGTRSLEMSKIVSISPQSDAIEVSVENRQKSSGFSCTNPFKVWAIGNTCARMPDPGKFGTDTIELDFTLPSVAP
ncbi:MAG: hypothetical protein RL077_1333 [Verrucomicrobiota bacterium]|jgi:hypothetical protein